MIFDSSYITDVRSEIEAINNDEKLSVFMPAQIVLKNYSVIRIELRITAALFEGQKIILANFLDVDYSKYVNNNEQIKNALDMFANTATDLVFVLNSDKTIKFATANLNKILGFSNDEIKLPNFLQTILDDRYRDFCIKFDEKANKKTKEDLLFEIKLKNKAREDKFFEAIITNKLYGNFFQGIIFHLREISERKIIRRRKFKINFELP